MYFPLLEGKKATEQVMINEDVSADDGYFGSLLPFEAQKIILTI